MASGDCVTVLRAAILRPWFAVLFVAPRCFAYRCLSAPVGIVWVVGGSSIGVTRISLEGTDEVVQGAWVWTSGN